MAGTIKVMFDGKEVEVDAPEGWMSAEDIAGSFMKKDTFEKEMERRIASAKKGLVSQTDLLSNEDFLTEILKAQGKELFDPAKAKGKKGADDEAIAQRLTDALAEWRKKELEPMAGERDKAIGRIGSLQTRILRGQIIEAAVKAGVKGSFLKAPQPGADPPIVAMLGSIFRHDGDHDDFFVAKGENDFEFSAKPDEGTPYKGVGEFVTDWASQKENLDFIDASLQSGPGLGQPGPGRVSGKDVHLTQEQASDHQTYTKATEQASKQGGRVVTAPPGMASAVGPGLSE